jgi:hypothetical protein
MPAAPAWLRKARSLGKGNWPTSFGSFMSRLLLAAVAAASLLAAGHGQARELGAAPTLRVLGFSADGRYFGFEQEGGDGVHDKGAFAIDVIDRTTGAFAAGFPRGVTQLAWDSPESDTRRAAMRGFRFDEDKEETTTTEAIRRWVRSVTRRPLQALRLNDPGHRLGGRPLTDLTEVQGPVRVMTHPDIIGAHPGVSMKYTVTAAMPVPDDPDLACREREEAVTFPLTIKLTPDIPSWDQEAATRQPEAFRERSIVISYVLPPKTCFTAARVTDVYRSSNNGSIAVVVAMILDVGFTDSAEYRAALFQVGNN